ncbi:class I adenylate-forming enzyme family protein [Nonomuraea sp. NPDC050786]|uniref:class I adenylate-forming enzyme family protein n=1 Tax=Nonomuraea sp. NPDC050786 TaxID=3154840 RepID=UPI0033EC8296
MTLTVPELLRRRSTIEPTRLAIVVSGGGSLTFLEWEERSNALADGLLNRGLARAAKVGLLFSDWIEFAVAYVGVQKAGGVAVPLLNRSPAVDLRWMLEDCGAAGVIHDPTMRITGWPGWAATSDSLDTGRSTSVEIELGPQDAAQILYTSGTSGRAKGVEACHANLTFDHDVDPSRRILAHSRHFAHAFPIGTNAGQTMLINALTAAPTALVLPDFTPGRFLRLIETYKAGTVFAVPAMAARLVGSGRELPFVRLFGSTGAALPPAVAAAMSTLFPNAAIVNSYTSTEAAPAATTMIFDPARSESVGRPARTELMITTADGKQLPDGETGEVWLRSGAPTRSYIGAPDSGVFKDGWVRMGDLGHLDNSGYLYLVDRESDVIKCGGFKVSTLHVEAQMHEHPAVREASVFGIPHPELGAAVAAAVVLHRETSPSELRAFLLGRLASHEIPVRLLVLDRLPRNDGGKVSKLALRQLVNRIDHD